MNYLSACVLSLLVVAALARPQDNSKCKPNINCRLPHCRCWNDALRPGNFTNAGTPQIISIAFAYAMNEEHLGKYLPLFDGLSNPNNCPVKGTFFTQNRDTDVASLKKLYAGNHEVALTSADGSIPADRRKWLESLFQSSEKVYDAGIPHGKIKGARSPSSYMGGNDELQAELQFGMSYEASCIFEFDETKEMLWPFTYDFVGNNPRCGVGKTPNTTFPGIWQFMVPEMSFRKHPCTTLSSCSPYINNTADAFSMIYNAFQRHYYSSRAPMILYIDPMWLAKEHQVKGLKQFLEVVSRFDDTWMVTLSQALEWVKYPVPMYDTVIFRPWECRPEEKMNVRKMNTRRRR